MDKELNKEEYMDITPYYEEKECEDVLYNEQNYEESHNETPDYVDRASSLVDNISSLTQSMSMVVDKAQNLASVYSQCVEMNAKTQQVNAWSQTQIANTIAKYKVCEDFLTKSFGERNGALQKHYDILDEAVNKGDREMIIAALQNISSIVTTSPLQDLQKFTELFNDPDQALLDF